MTHVLSGVTLLTMQKYLIGMALKTLLVGKRNKQMTKLEELDKAYAAAIAVRQELLDAVDIVDYKLMLASEAYYAELKKQGGEDK
tara:strand:+ start:276 stop:530 length:255 start_codon:yes stop_codon:yes gene_type:complete